MPWIFSKSALKASRMDFAIEPPEALTTMDSGFSPGQAAARAARGAPAVRASASTADAAMRCGCVVFMLGVSSTLQLVSTGSERPAMRLMPVRTGKMTAVLNYSVKCRIVPIS
jgi:hypothetical protein